MFQHKADEKDIKKSKVTKTDIPILGTHVIVWIENSQGRSWDIELFQWQECFIYDKEKGRRDSGAYKKPLLTRQKTQWKVGKERERETDFSVGKCIVSEHLDYFV